jgi:nicotinamide-nucleotide amidase
MAAACTLLLTMSHRPEFQALCRRLGKRALAKGRRIVTVESCTGGFIAKSITDIAGSSQWFEEGFVTYGNDAKRRRLGVLRSLLEAKGAVSREVARAMAEGALARTDANLIVAVTGIAGPSGAAPGKPVGTVFLAWARRLPNGRVTIACVRKQFRGDRDAVRRKTVRLALQGLLAR